MRRMRYIQGVRFFEAVILETEAQKQMMPLIQKHESLKEAIGLLRRAGDTFETLGEQKRADTNYFIAIVLMALEEFHAGNIGRANQILNGAKEQLLGDFALSIYDQINESWQPLKYTLAMIEEFNRYSRRIETEKGFSFESRVREVLAREYSAYRIVESKSFAPDEDEIGIVFRDNSRIEIDIFGLRQEQRKYLLLIGEIKNLQQPVDVRASICLPEKWNSCDGAIRNTPDWKLLLEAKWRLHCTYPEPASSGMRLIRHGRWA